MVGSPDRRAITVTSNSSTPIVTARVTIHSSNDTCNGLPPVGKNQRSLPPSRSRRPAARTPDGGRRDDDAAAEEYSPPPMSLSGRARRSLLSPEMAVSSFEP